MARMSRVSSMGELTASLAHELNQPLTAIASNAAAGRRLLAQGTPDLEMFEELLADVSADARRAGDIIHG
ncbi:MAG: nodulation protein V, partial [Verrucomicrobia bacterium]